ncbi:D-alanine--D-alanine ligase [bacterium]|nr:D-alanine--D-alanine ligase [bacterium]
MKKLKVAVLFGGPSTERVVSIESGKNVIKNLDPDRYDVIPVEIDRTGRWWMGEVCPSLTEASHIHEPETHRPATGQVRPRADLVPREFNGEAIDVAIIAMHGAYGEDGRLQGFLEMLGIRYTGSNVAASALAMSKLRSKEVFVARGIPTPRYLPLHCADVTPKRLDEIAADLGLPLVVKSDLSGSSIGVFIVHDRPELTRAVEGCCELSPWLVFEEYCRGTELTCAVLAEPHGGEPLILPPTEIVPAREFFDYESKYLSGATQEITPARLSESDTRRAQATALAAHRALGCRGISRTDMVLCPDGIRVLEVNTIPGMSPMSLVPRAAAAVGMPFGELLDRLIAL